MKQDKEVLEQLELIKSTILDKDALLANSGKSFIIWGIISIILFLGMPFFHIYQEFDLSIITSSIFMLVLLIFGLSISIKFLKQKNKENERKLSKYQRLRNHISIFTIIFGFILTIILSKNLSAFIPIIWMALIGISFTIEGYFSKQIMTKYGLFLVYLSFFISLIYILLIDNYDIGLYFFSATIGSLFLGVGSIVLGIKFLKEDKLNV